MIRTSRIGGLQRAYLKQMQESLKDRYE